MEAGVCRHQAKPSQPAFRGSVPCLLGNGPENSRVLGKQEVGKGSNLGEDTYSRERADPTRGEDLGTFVKPRTGIISSEEELETFKFFFK